MQFNADVADGMPWKFIPTQREVFPFANACFTHTHILHKNVLILILLLVFVCACTIFRLLFLSSGILVHEQKTVRHKYARSTRKQDFQWSKN